MIFSKQHISSFFITFFIVIGACVAQQNLEQYITKPNYLDSLKIELQKRWPNNKQINLVFHGHSVPTGYTTRGVVDRLNAYPYQTLKKVNDLYPYSVVNTITTSIGGEQAEQGAKRFKTEVLNHNPDVLFIDYALNDRGIGLEKAKKAWEQMVQEALEYGTKVILLTPTPDTREDISSDDSNLAKHSQQIRAIAKKYDVALVDSYKFFKDLASIQPLDGFMAQGNHVNQKGHQFVADIIANYFKISPKESKE